MKKKKISVGRIILNAIMIIMSLGYIVPILLMISISFTKESLITQNGYSLIPEQWVLDAYKIVFRNPTQIINSYKVTIAYSVLATMIAVIVQTLMAYPLARNNFHQKKFITVYLMITMFFSGGIVPSYILNTQYLHLGNTFWIYIFPGLMSAWNVILFKTYFKGLPDSLIEAAKLDGASELKIYRSIIMPLSLPIIACIAFTMLLGKWNDWNTSLLYIRNNKLYSLQYLLQRIMNETDYIRKMSGTENEALVGNEIPAESMRYAIAVIAAGPMMIVFPFFQKYFAKGLVVGSVKG
ncbi:MAG: carbohydrate ABC transporter permease [Clostridia bacterium]|nr:carbohydrate ABC transporter permease [Clostridia bacterium]